MNKWLFIAAVNGALAVLAGAFAAHALRQRLAPEALASFTTAAHYHLLHALAMGLAALAMRGRAAPRARLSAALFLAGIVLFSGSLYLWPLTGRHMLVFVTPLGGLALVAGWVALALAALKLQEQ
ncbi:MAG TPA: DUF423 domain-containing protein [Rhizomicrobium sp.]|jgi:uncharacterized membrane protein YgdD (TMEM256/DUF423 family)|nr:DUF423 domain-containing protein [Rhizomicrobium sp.]